MIQRVAIEGVTLPRLYMAENNEDIRMCKEQGIPFIKWSSGMESLIKMLLRPTLEKMFPHIKWNEVLGRRRSVASNVILSRGSEIEDSEDFDPSMEISVEYDHEKMLEAQFHHQENRGEHVVFDEDEDLVVDVDKASSRRSFSNGTSGHYDNIYEDSISIEEYVGDLTSCVNIEVLQRLGMLPKFIGDIADCIKVNLSNNLRWTEGYNKKLGVPVGKFNGGRQLPNLIILDVSASIPRGIAATMLSLIDTMRDMCDADLIITASRSGYYPSGCKLPSPQTLRDYYRPGQEAEEFIAIMEKHIKGREFGHVICFGDDDAPTRVWKWRSHEDLKYRLEGTKVHELHSYHTSSKANLAGYCEWVPETTPGVPTHYDTSWCKIMKD